MTVYLKTLEAAGLIRREIDRDDLRRHRLVLTTRGSATLHEAQAVLAREFQQSLAALNTAERTDFRRLLEKILIQAPNPTPNCSGTPLSATDNNTAPAGRAPSAKQ